MSEWRIEWVAVAVLPYRSYDAWGITQGYVRTDAPVLIMDAVVQMHPRQNPGHTRCLHWMHAPIRMV